MTTTRTVAVNGWEFTVRTAGAEGDPAVVLLHGFPTDGTCFDQVVERLTDSGLRTIVPDQRGYSPGARPADVGEYALSHLVSDVIGILDALNIGYAQVVGHDLGGLVAWHLAALHPRRVSGLVTVGTGHPSAMVSALADSDQRQRSSYIAAFCAPDAEDVLLADGAAALRAVVPDDSVCALMTRPALTAALAWYRANFTAEHIANLACPPIEVATTMVWSDADPFLGREQAERSGRFVYSDFRFCELSGVDHWIPHNASAALAAEIALRSATL